MKEIELCGKKAIGMKMIVDDEDFNIVSKYKWYIQYGYAISVKHVSGNKKNRNQKYLSAHRLIMGLETGDKIVIDHKNHNTLDNRKENLRLCTPQQNSANTRKLRIGTSQCSSQYKGVFRISDKCWCARSAKDSIGYFLTEEMAAKAYDQFVLNKYEEFAILNFPNTCDYSGIIRCEKHNKHERSSKVKNVSYSHTRKDEDRWRVVYKKKHYGWFITENEAIECITNIRKLELQNQTKEIKIHENPQDIIIEIEM